MGTLQLEKIVHRDGTETTEIEIPSLDTKMVTAWVCYNGTGTPSILDSYNVTSITDIDVGRHYVNFASAMTHTSYAVVKCAASASSVRQLHSYSDLTINSVRVNSYSEAVPEWNDSTHTSVVILGGK